MIKQGVVSAPVTPCLVCGEPSSITIGQDAFCDAHAGATKTGSYLDIEIVGDSIAGESDSE